MIKRPENTSVETLPIVKLDKEFCISAMNSTASKLLAGSPNSHFIDLIEDARNKVVEVFEHSFSGFTNSLEISFEKIGRYHVQITPILIEDGTVSHLNLVLERVDRNFTPQNEGKMLRAIIDNIPDYIFVKDRNHKSILSNTKFRENILGNYENGLTGKPTPLDYFDPEKGREIIKDNERVMKTGVPVINRPDVVETRQGKEERVLLTKVPLKDEFDQITGLVGIARDISENYAQNKRQDLTLKIVQSFSDKPNLKEAMVRALELLCDELNFDYGESYKLSVNKFNLKRNAQWPQKESLEKLNIPLEKEEGLPGKAWTTKKVQIGRKTENPEYFDNDSLDNLSLLVCIPIIMRDETIAVIQLGSQNDREGVEKLGLDEIAIQIASAIESKSSRDQLNDFFNHSTNLVAVVGLDGFAKMINPAFIHKFGYTQEEILNIPFTEFIHPEDLPQVLQAIQDVHVPGSMFELRCRKQDGDYLWISWCFSQFIEGENIVHAFGTDITPLKNALDELSKEIEEREKVQAELRLSEKKYRNLFEISPLPMWVVDRDQLRFLDVNKAAIRLYGYSREEFLNMTVRDLWAPNQEERINRIVEENYDDFFKLKVEHKTKSGRSLFVSLNSNPLVYDGINARVSLINDITEMVEAEKKLKDREKRFKALIQEGSDLISIIDKDHNYLYNSPATEGIFGLKPGELNGVNFKNFIYEKDLLKVEASLEELSTTKRVQLPSYRIRNSKGEWRWIETIATDLSDDSAVGGVVLNSRDITQFILQERKVKESLHRYDVVARATSDIITDYDIQKDEVTFNEAASKVLGYNAENIGQSGKWWDEKIHPEDLTKIKSQSRKMKEEGVKYLTTEYRFRCADGTYKYFLDRSYLLTDDNGIPRRIIGSMQDITDRKKHLLQVEDHNRRLKKIAWTQSHVVRAPLAKIMGLVDLLTNYRNDIEDAGELLDNILLAAEDLDKIIREIASETEKEILN